MANCLTAIRGQTIQRFGEKLRRALNLQSAIPVVQCALRDRAFPETHGLLLVRGSSYLLQ